MSYALRKKRGDNVVQWRGDNIEEIKYFINDHCRAYDVEIQQPGSRLLLSAGFSLEVLELTDWFAPITPNGSYTRLTDIAYDDYYERGP